MGVGQRSCGQFIATISKIPPGEAGIMHTRDGLFVSENVEYQQWLSGFVSGFNDAHADDLGFLDCLEQQSRKVRSAK